SSVVLGAKKREQDEKEKRYVQIYEETLKMVEEGQALSVLNPGRSREILLASQSKISEMETLGVEISKTTELKDKLTNALAGVMKEYKLIDVPVFTDLTLIASDGRGDRMALFGQSLIILDKTKNRVLGLDMKRKSPEILAGGGTLSETKLVILENDYGYIFEKEGLARINVGNKKTVKAVIKISGEWGQIAAMGIFGGNIYLLDTGKNEIWRYGATADGFGTGQSWFASGTTPDLSGVVSMAVDGVIWGLTQDGKILKFVQGSPTAFGVSGLVTGFSSPSVIYTNDEIENLYILDNGNGRVVVLAKSGEYKAEYLWDGFKEATDMVVQEADKKIFLLSGSRIYEIALR
ncbi:MAG: hypothetical protein Q8Q15_01580, partial [bacterium]|nr:hypothetical protein [bacterium]